MLGRGKSPRTLGEHEIFGDEEAARITADLEELKAQIVDLNARVHSQFTTIAAHAEIARQQAEFVRDEARADLDRTRDTVLGLVEQVRDDVQGLATGTPTTAQTAWPAPAGAEPLLVPAAQDSRFDAIERRLDTLAGAVERCFDRQRELANTMEALLDTVLAVQLQQPQLSHEELVEADEPLRPPQLAIALT